MIKNIITNVQTENKTDADYWSRPAVTEKVMPPFSRLPSVESLRLSNGKIARLPADLRDSVNQWVTDSIPFDIISQRLAALGHPGISQQNISNWKANGYLKWLQHQDQLDDQRTRYEMACQMAKDLGHSDDSTRACTMLITTRLFELLLSSADQSDPETARKDTLQILQLSRALSVHLGESARNDRLQFDKQRHQEKIAALAELARSKVFHSEDNALNQFSRMLGLRPRGAVPDRGSPEPQQPQTSAATQLTRMPNSQIHSSTHPSIHQSATCPPSSDKLKQACATQNTNPAPHASNLQLSSEPDS